MVLNLCVLAFVLGITFLNSLHGLFSGLINLFCCVVAGAVSFGCFEALADLLTREFELPGTYAVPGCFIGLFVITLLILRVLADSLIRGNVRIPMYVDWGGGGVCGLLIGMISIGILVLGFTMLPFGGRVAMFERFERTEDAERGVVVFNRRNVWLKPDAFAAGLFGMLSKGSLRGPQAFARVYPDFPAWVSWTANTVQPESFTAPARRGSSDGFRQGLRVQGLEEVKGAVGAYYRKESPTEKSPTPEFRPMDYSPEPGNKLLRVRLELLPASAEGEKTLTHHRFRPTMIRLVGQLTNGSPRQYVPRLLGGCDSNRPGVRVVDPDNNFALEAGDKTIVDAFFEVSDDFRPAFVEYRRFARAAIAGAGEVAGGELATPKAPAGAAETAGTPVGQMGFIEAVITAASGDIDRLPLQLSRDAATAAGDVTVEGHLYVSGRFAGPRAQLEAKGIKVKQLSHFRVPLGYRVCQIQFRPRRAGSLAGQVFNFVARTVNQYCAVDANGTKHRLAGYYAFIPRPDGPFVEFYYASDADDPTNRGLLDFKEVKASELTAHDDAIVGLVFLVPPRTVIKRIENQAGAGVEGLNIEMGG